MPQNEVNSEDGESKVRYIAVAVPEKPLPGMDKVVADAVLEDLDTTFSEIFKNPFTNAVCKIPGGKLQLKKTPSQLKRERRAIHKKVSCIFVKIYKLYAMLVYFL